jgi:purine-binding chemotaxis protein CheW
VNHSSTKSTLSCDKPRAGAGKYLTFTLNAQEYGLPILKVREIIQYLHVTPVPGAPASVSGVINLRGQVIAVTDLRRALGMPAAERSGKMCIIIVDIARAAGTARAGLLVDSVCEVLNIPAENVEEAAVLGATAPPAHLMGLARIGDSVRILLDVDHLPGSENSNERG